MFLLFYGMLFFIKGSTYVFFTFWPYLLLLCFALMQFSYKDFLLRPEDTEAFYYRYRILGVFRFSVRKKFAGYSYFICRVVRKTFVVKQGMGAGMVINEGVHREKYYAILGKSKKNREMYEICKGEKKELDNIIRERILPLTIPVYLGVKKKGYEYQ